MLKLDGTAANTVDLIRAQRHELQERRDSQDTWRQTAEIEAQERAAEVVRLDALLADIDRTLDILTRT